MAKRVTINYTGKKVLVLGSGGASNTVCAVMQELGANVTVISRSGVNNYSNLHLHRDCAVIVNTTPVGMYPNTDRSPVDLSVFPNLEAVLDLIYNPMRTKLLIDAQVLGLKTENGLWMLVAQAKESAEWFTGNTIEDSEISKIHRLLRKQNDNIILVGMPGCGKTTNGRILAEALSKQFVDSDVEVEKHAGCTIPEIFRTYGEEHFRKLEAKVLSDIGKKTNLVIATGGGCVTREENLSSLQQNGTVIWLKRPIADLPTNGRPLSQANSLTQMYDIRKPLYEKFSDYSLECGPSATETANALIKLLNEKVFL